MVKVVGLDESAIKRTTCGKCASILEYTESEVQWIKHSQDYLGDYETNLGIKCPKCNSNVFTSKRR